MPKLVFINLPVCDLKRSIAFAEALGATVNPQFTDETAACMVFSDTIHVMLLTHEKFSQFAHRPIADAKAVTQVLICLSVDSRAEVDATVARAVAAGGEAAEDAQDYGFMYARGVYDPDGHGYEFMWFDPAAAEAGAEARPELAHA